MEKDARCSPSRYSFFCAAAAAQREHAEAGWFVCPVFNDLVLVLVLVVVLVP